MTLFDPKEEVLDIQLTQYGRHLLSKGRMKPVYYAFFDEGIIYDLKHAVGGGRGPEENKNDAEARIQEETPQLKTRHSFTGRDEFLFDGVNDRKDKIELGIYERLYSLTNALGTSDLNSTKSPYYSLTCLKGEIESTVDHLTGTVRTTNIPSGSVATYSNQLLKIPQIEMNIEYKIAAIDPLATDLIKFETEPALSSEKVYDNGLSVLVGPEEILLLIEEGNASCDYKNFDIEVFEMTGLSGSIGEEVLEPLSFVRPMKRVKDNLLLDVKEAEALARRRIGEPFPAGDSSYVEYYFNIDVDDEIDKNTICKSINKFKKRGRNIYSPCGVDFDCPDLEEVVSMDIYDSDSDRDEC